MKRLDPVGIIAALLITLIIVVATYITYIDTKVLSAVSSAASETELQQACQFFDYTSIKNVPLKCIRFIYKNE